MNIIGIIDSVMAFFIFIGVKSYFDSLFTRKQSKKIFNLFWILGFIFTGLLGNYLDSIIPLQLNTIIMCTTILIFLYEGDWYKKVFSIFTFVAISSTFEIIVYFLLDVGNNENLYEIGSTLSKGLTIIFICFVIYMAKRIKKNTILLFSDWAMLIILPVVSLGVASYMAFGEGVELVPKLLVCTLLVLINANVFVQFILLTRSKEKHDHKDLRLEEQKRKIVEQEDAIKYIKSKQDHKIFYFGSKTNIKSIELEKVIYFEAYEGMVVIHSKNEEVNEYRSTLKNLQKELSKLGSDNFIRVNQSQIINFDFVTKKETDKFYINDICFYAGIKFKNEANEQYNSLLNKAV